MKMDFHEIASIFPLMGENELSTLADDVKAHGLLQPIVLHEGKILDGRNRYLACQQAGVEPRFETYTGDDPLSYVVSVNLHRRHLTREQRDEVIRQLRGQGMTVQKIADAVGVSRDTAHRVTRDVLISEIGIENTRGQLRPSHYAPRQDPIVSVEVEFGEDTEDAEDTQSEIDEDTYEASDLSPVGIIPPEEAKVLSKPHVAYNAGNNEWYTPPEYIERAKAVMGAIDLDPASTEIANTVVGAMHFYTAKEDGLTKPWKGRVWMNPPYASEFIGKFVDKLLTSPEVTEAIVLVNNATETQWFQALAQAASAVCFPSGRVKFWNPDKESAPLQGQAVLYIGESNDKFIHYFSDLGCVWRK